MLLLLLTMKFIFMNKEQERLLWKYIDGECNQIEKADIEKQLEEDPEFFEEYMLCLQLHSKFNKIHQRKGRKKEENEVIDLSFLDDVEMKSVPALSMVGFTAFKVFTSALIAFLWVSGFELIKYIYAHASNMSLFSLILAYALMSAISLYIPITMYRKTKKFLLAD